MGVAEQLMRRHVASRRGDGLACASLQLRSPGDGASPALHGCCTPPGPLTCVGPPCPPGDAFTLLLLSSSLPRVLLFCFSSHVLLNERGESRGWPRGWGRVDVAVVASHPNRAQVTHSQPCVPDAGWRHPVLRALLIPVGDKAARTGPDPAPLEDVRSPGIRAGFLGSSVLKPEAAHVLVRSCKKLPTSFSPVCCPSSLCSGANVRRRQRAGGVRNADRAH